MFKLLNDICSVFQTKVIDSGIYNENINIVQGRTNLIYIYIIDPCQKFYDFLWFLLNFESTNTLGRIIYGKQNIFIIIALKISLYTNRKNKLFHNTS